jgi:hypothetical protein
MDRGCRWHATEHSQTLRSSASFCPQRAASLAEKTHAARGSVGTVASHLLSRVEVSGGCSADRESSASSGRSTAGRWVALTLGQSSSERSRSSNARAGVKIRAPHPAPAQCVVRGAGCLQRKRSPGCFTRCVNHLTGFPSASRGVLGCELWRWRIHTVALRDEFLVGWSVPSFNTFAPVSPTSAICLERHRGGPRATCALTAADES